MGGTDDPTQDMVADRAASNSFEDSVLDDHLLQGLRAVTLGHDRMTPGPTWTRPCSQQMNEKHDADYEVYYINDQLYAVSREGEFFFYPVNIGPGVRRDVERIRLRHDILHTRGRITHAAWTRAQGRHECHECHEELPTYIFECRECGWKVCNRCRLNALGISYCEAYWKKGVFLVAE